MRSTSQEETLSGKPSFEKRTDRFGVKIKIYHAYNGIFSEQYFRSAIEDANQNIKFCGVGSHHQNDIFEIKIQTLTLGAKKLIRHEKRYWPEEISKKLWTYELNYFAEQSNVIKVDDDGINPMEKFVGTTTYIYIKIDTHGAVQFMS